MKRKILSGLLVIGMLMTLLSGCGGTKESESENTETEDIDTEEPVVEEPVVEEPIEEEAVEESYITLDGYFEMLECTSVFDGEELIEETQSINFAGVPGTTLGAALEEIGYTSIKPIENGDTFEGWMEFKVVIVTDENGFEEYTYERVSDELYTTEEIMEKTFTEETMAYIVKWASIDMDSYYAEDESWDEGYSVTAESRTFALNPNGGIMNFENSEFGDLNYDYTYWVDNGTTLNDLIAKDGTSYSALVSIEKEGYEFAGWTVYQGNGVTWASEESAKEGDMSFLTGMGYEGFEYAIIGDCSLLEESVTTEELYEMVVDSVDLYAVANWN